ncbi:MAG: peptide chain release factor N(5)-glutamine methyltransferase [Acidimicrobiia bacterium]
MTTWKELRVGAAQQLRDAGLDTAEVEARWLVEEVSGLDAAELVAEEGETATNRGALALEKLLARRMAGEPIQYVLGHWSFRGLDLSVDPRVLIPRPETEVVVEYAIAEAVRLGATRRASNAWAGGETHRRIADLGTGSGAIAFALAAELSDVEVFAVDASADACAVARANLAGIGNPGVRVRILEGSWFDALPAELRGEFSVIVSNPPYLADRELDEIEPSVRDFEPASALASGPTGLEDFETIIRGAPRWLTAAGALVLEIAPHQVDPLRALALGAGFDDVAVRRDLAGRDRVLVARRGYDPHRD